MTVFFLHNYHVFGNHVLVLRLFWPALVPRDRGGRRTAFSFYESSCLMFCVICRVCGCINFVRRCYEAGLQRCVPLCIVLVRLLEFGVVQLPAVPVILRDRFGVSRILSYKHCSNEPGRVQSVSVKNVPSVLKSVPSVPGCASSVCVPCLWEGSSSRVLSVPMCLQGRRPKCPARGKAPWSPPSGIREGVLSVPAV